MLHFSAIGNFDFVFISDKLLLLIRNLVPDIITYVIDQYKLSIWFCIIR